MPKDWAAAKDHIQALYIDRRLSLDEVRKVMAEVGLHASERTYKNKFAEWGWQKNRTRKRKIRSRQEAMPTYESAAEVDLVGPLNSWWNVNTTDPNFPVSPGPTGRADLNIASVLSLNIPLIDIRDSDGRTRLDRAVLSGDTKAVDDLLCMGANVHLVDVEGNQPIHLAAAGAFTGIIKVLLKWDADVNARGPKGQRPLHLARHHLRTIRTLLKDHPNLSAQDDQGNTALHQAILSQGWEDGNQYIIVKRLILAGANVNAPNHDSISPFHMVVSGQGSYEWVSKYTILFLQHGADIMLPTPDNELPFTLFLAQPGLKLEHRLSAQIIHTFLCKGADSDTKIADGTPLLSYALKHFGRYWSPRIYKDSCKMLDMICERARIDLPCLDGNLPLHVAAKPKYAYRTEHLEILIGRGAALNSLNENGESPLLIALQSGRLPDFIQILLNGGANAMQRDSLENLPIYVAMRCYSGDYRKKMITMLLNAYVQDETLHNQQLEPSDDELWWHSYHKLLINGEWSEITRPSVPAAGVPTDLAYTLPQCMLAIAAERILGQIKERLLDKTTDSIQSSDEVAALRDNTVRILRDSRLLQLEIDPSWYQFLLDLLP